MITTYLGAILGLVGLMVGWMLVQAGWRRTFADYLEDDDVLADRRSCGNCGCTTACRRPISKSTEKA